MLARLFQFLLDYPKSIGLVLLGVVIFFVIQVPRFELDASSDSLVLENDQDLRYFQQIQRQYRTADQLIISYTPKSDGLFSSIHLQNLQNLQTQIASLSLINSVISILDVPLFYSPPIALSELANKYISLKNGNADMALAQKELVSNPFYVNNLISADGQTTALVASLEPNTAYIAARTERDDLRLLKQQNKLSQKQSARLTQLEAEVKHHLSEYTEQLRTLVTQVHQISKPYKQNAEIFLGGLPLIVSDIIRYIENDLLVFSLAVILLMTLVLAVIFRKWRWILMPILTSLLVALVMTGVLGFLGWKVTVISSNFFSLLLVMTLSVIIHLIVRYRELAQAEPHKPKQQLIHQTLRKMSRPCLFTTLTTLVAFSSLIVSGIRPVIDFGQMMAIGVSLALVLAFLLFAISMQLLPKQAQLARSKQFTITGLLARLTDRYGNLLLVIALAAMIIAVIGITRLSVENRFIDYFKKDTEINQGLSLIDQKLGGTTPLEIIIDDWGYIYWKDNLLRQEVHQIQTFLDELPTTGKVLSIDVPLQLLTQLNNNQPLSGFFLNVVRKQVPQAAKDLALTPYISDTNGQLRFVARIKDSDPLLKRQNLLDEIRHYLVDDMRIDPNKLHLSGMFVLYNNMLQSLFKSQILTMGAVFLMIFLMFIIVFRSVVLSLLGIIANILPSFLVLGAMGIFGIPLDLMTITIAAIAIGIGVDNAIHYIHRFKIEFRKDGDYRQAMYRAHASIGLAMFYTAITITLGFLVLSLSNFIPSIYFGIFTAFAMLAALFANLTLLPQLILLTKPRIKQN